jgi:hypothetical protein
MYWVQVATLYRIPLVIYGGISCHSGIILLSFKLNNIYQCFAFIHIYLVRVATLYRIPLAIYGSISCLLCYSVVILTYSYISMLHIHSYILGSSGNLAINHIYIILFLYCFLYTTWYSLGLSCLDNWEYWNIIM